MIGGYKVIFKGQVNGKHWETDRSISCAEELIAFHLNSCLAQNIRLISYTSLTQE
jgi:hypothetical protein